MTCYEIDYLICFFIPHARSICTDLSIRKKIRLGYRFFKRFITKKGQIKWFPHVAEKLNFRETEKDKVTKYALEEIAGFSADTLQFHSLFNFEVYGDNYALLGKMSKIKQTFGEVLDTGRFNIYLVAYTGYNAISGSLQSYPNIIFENKDNPSVLVAYPFAIRMTAKKYENAKEKLIMLFKDYPEIVTKIQAYKRENDFFEVINAVKAINMR